MAPTSVRALHFVFKIADRTATIAFIKNVLGMSILRHEEFDDGCKAACNGPYENRWSKTMVGYGREDDHFVLELTYNYCVTSYERGNDFEKIVIKSPKAYSRAKALSKENVSEGESITVRSPDGYAFQIINEKVDGCPVAELVLKCMDIQKSKEYWGGFLDFKVLEETDTEAVFSCRETSCRLRLRALPSGEAMDHKTGYGRVAFSCPGSELKQLEADVIKANCTVLTPYVSLETPGKANVEVVILADPDGHEICFVGHEGFRDLSQIDPAADSLLKEAMDNDKSKEWAEKAEKIEAAAGQASLNAAGSGQ